MATWPATLPDPLINTLKESPADNSIRTQMDKGPAKMRRRTTANTKPIAFTMILTDAQLTALDAFYTATTFSGAISFDYTHPRTMDSVTARFTQPPSYSDVNGTCYRAEVQLEILP